jgi:hypothetical protein
MFFYKVWPKIFGVADSESMRCFLTHSRSIRFFGAWSSANHVLLVSHSLAIRFLGAESWANQVLLLSHPRAIRFSGAGSWANQVLSLSHSRPIRFFWVGSSAKQVISLYHSRPSRFFGAGISAKQVISVSRSRPIRFLEAWSSGKQMILRPGSRPMTFLERVKSRSMSGFFKICGRWSFVRWGLLRKGKTVYKVWPNVFENEESKAMSAFRNFLNLRITLWDVSSLNNVSFSIQPNFCFRIVLSEVREVDALLLIKYFSTSSRSIFIVFVRCYSWDQMCD